MYIYIYIYIYIFIYGRPLPVVRPVAPLRGPAAREEVLVYDIDNNMNMQYIHISYLYIYI